MDTKDWLTILAALIGPILAVQAQKAVEAFRERRSRKAMVFSQLMATRAARVSPEHVQALNMIDIVFFGSATFGFLHRSKTEKAVLDAWKEYHDHLGVKAEGEGLRLWNAKSDELLINLLFAMSLDVGYTFDRVQLKRGAYSPVAHGDLENELSLLRKAAIGALTGESSLRMNVVGFPVNPEAAAQHQEAIRRLSVALEDGALQVRPAGTNDKP